MIGSVDIETQGLNCTKFILGTLVIEDKETPETYYNKEELWKRIKELGDKQNKRGKTLQLYAHNHAYDFYGYANLEDDKIKYISQRPFIANYLNNNKKETIKFLDTYNIFKMNLAELAIMIGTTKIEPPKEIYKGEITKEHLKELEKYNIQDTKIVLQAIQYLKGKLKEENLNMKRLMTINQIAIQYLIKKLQKQPEKQTEHLFYNQKKGEFYRTFRRQEIHEAYRGGNVRLWKTGQIDEVTVIDKRNLYGYALSKMRCPDLRTEQKIWNPLTTTPTTIKEIIEPIGITRCLIKNKNNQLGILPIRTPNGNYYPEKDKYLIGTWTNTELQQATQNGYEIRHIEWTINYKQAFNPFTEIMRTTYGKRMEAGKGTFNYWFYKEMQNNGIGKLAQCHTEQEMTIDSVEKAQQYLNEKYEITKGIGKGNYMYTKKEVNFKPKKYYVPIIPTLVNATARIIMNQEYEKIPKKDLIYTDTDSIHFTGDHTNKFKIGKELGEFKIEHEKEPGLYYAKKTYSIGDDIKIAGIHKKGLQIKDFKEGIIQSKQMITINTTKNLSEVGTFRNETRDLKKQTKEHKRIQEMYEQNTIFIDENIKDISNYIKIINENI